MSETQTPPATASDGEYPQIWEIHAQLVAARQRLLQALMAFYIQKDSCIEELFAVEQELGLPQFIYVPKTPSGQNSLMKFNSVAASYKKVFDRFKEVYELE